MMRRPLRFVLSAAALALPLAIAASASAQTSRVPGSTWRQRDRADALRNSEMSPQSFAFELRFGPYSSEFDESPGANGTYAHYFGSSPQFYFGLEFDYLPFRIPYAGVIGAGFGWGYTTTSATAKLKDGSDSGEEVRFSTMPMHLSAVFRADELMRRTGVPIVPYVKFGYGLGWWRFSDSDGTLKRTGTGGDKDEALGLTSGYHFAVGGALSLNFLDPRAIASLDQTMGVNHVYIFAEWMKARLTGPSSRQVAYVGTSTVIGGLAMDM